MSEDHFNRSVYYATKLTDRRLILKDLYIKCVNYIEARIIEQALIYENSVQIRMHETILKFLSIAEMDEMVEMLQDQGYSAYRDMSTPATLHIRW